MFCPNCKIEYRTGFTKCSDCGVDLVEHLPEETADVPTDADGMELLWSGVFPAGPFNALREALDDAGIRHKDTNRNFGLLPNLAQNAEFVWIDPRDRDSARAVLAKVLAAREDEAQEPENFAEQTSTSTVNPFKIGQHVFNRTLDEQNASAEESEGSDEPLPEDFVENFDPDEATCEVWAGDDKQLAQTFDECLRNVGVGCVVTQTNGKTRVLVLPGSEKRAREVIREIVEQTPPE